MYPKGKTTRERSVDYRHVVHSLVKKPQAFRYSQLRDDLLPNDDYRTIWRYVDNTMEARTACRFITGILHLATLHDCEAKLAEVVLAQISQGRALSLSNLQAQFTADKTITQPSVEVVQHTLHQYDELIAPLAVCHG